MAALLASLYISPKQARATDIERQSSLCASANTQVNRSDRSINQSNMASASSSSSVFCLPCSSSPAAYSRSPAARVTLSRRQLRVSASCASTAERPSRTHIGSPGSLYEVLGIQAGASCQDIKAAYRRLARVLHPDVAPASSDCSGSDFIRIHEAYATLSDPQKRADYDRTLFTRRRRVSRPVAVSMSAAVSTGGSMNSGLQAYTKRRWETDQCW